MHSHWFARRFGGTLEVGGAARVEGLVEMQYVVGAVALTGVVGLVVALLGRGRRTDQAAVEAALEARVLGDVAAPRAASALPALEVDTAAGAAFDQLGRCVRAALGDDDACHTVVVTGPRPHDDNAWLGANLAIAMARDGHQVLLVDGRISDRHRRPMTPGPEAPGLYDVLQGVRLERAISPGPVDRLSVLPAGNAGAAPTTRIVESRFSSLTDQARGRFETVVVLGPALSTGADAAVMARTGAVLVAVPASLSPRELADCGRALREQSVEVVGAVLVGHH